MSYNNIGLKTSKGSSTSGHIQKSLANNEKKWDNKHITRNKKKKEVIQFFDSKINDHFKKRKIELEISKFRDELEESNVSESEIDIKCKQLKETLIKEEQENKVNYVKRDLRQV